MNYPHRSNYPQEGFQAARDGNERVLGLYLPHSVVADRSRGCSRRSVGDLVAPREVLAVASWAWHGKHQTAGVVCPGIGKLDAGS